MKTGDNQRNIAAVGGGGTVANATTEDATADGGGGAGTTNGYSPIPLPRQLLSHNNSHGQLLIPNKSSIDKGLDLKRLNFTDQSSHIKLQI